MARKASLAWKTENAFALCSAYFAKDFRREEVETKSNSLPARCPPQEQSRSRELSTIGPQYPPVHFTSNRSMPGAMSFLTVEQR